MYPFIAKQKGNSSLENFASNGGILFKFSCKVPQAIAGQRRFHQDFERNRYNVDMCR
jgi:uncharacterized protein YecE (DUF72 family)